VRSRTLLAEVAEEMGVDLGSDYEDEDLEPASGS
jgi:hypothetical protein